MSQGKRPTPEFRREAVRLALTRGRTRCEIANRDPSPGLVHHSDRGSQYCSIDYRAELRKRGLLISMSGKGNCYDNAMVETFFKTIEAELIWPVAWQTRQQAENAIARYIDGFYNPGGDTHRSASKAPSHSSEGLAR